MDFIIENWGPILAALGALVVVVDRYIAYSPSKRDDLFWGKLKPVLMAILGRKKRSP